MKTKFISLLKTATVAVTMLLGSTGVLFAETSQVDADQGQSVVEEMDGQAEAEDKDAEAKSENTDATEANEEQSEAVESEDQEVEMLAEKKTVSAKVTVSVQSGVEFIYEPKSLTVKSDLAESYGYEDKVDQEKGVSALDTIVAAHIDKYGADKATINSKLTMSYGNPKLMMDQDNGYTGFSINAGYAMDSNGQGYNTDSAPVKSNDAVSFFWYEDPNWGDYVSAFYDKNGKMTYSVKAKAGEKVELSLKGFMFMGGYQSSEHKPLEGVVICAIENGAISDGLYNEDKEYIETDENGKVSLDLAEGTYILSAADLNEDFGFRVVMPYLKVTVEKPTASKKANTAAKKISVKATKLKSVKAKGHKKFVVKWKSYKTGITGYQIRYSAKSNMSKAKTVTISKKKVSKKTIRKVSKGKKYVQVRTYKVVKGTKYYSDWSNKKSVKVK